MSTETMTGAELSLKIAEFLEPSANLPTWDDSTLDAQVGWECEDCGWFSSPLKCWRRFFAETPVASDMVNNPAMTVMLMLRRDFVSLNHFDESESELDITPGYEATFCPNEAHDINCISIFGPTVPVLGRAVAEAFAKAKGL